MSDAGFKNLTPEALRAFRENTDEKEYQLIDVRQPGEYEAAHIPGAILVPLPQLEARLFDLPADRDLVFYCHSGGRSRAAADLAAAAEVTERPVFNLLYGIMGWEGQTLADFPRVRALDPATPPAGLLRTAMDLEKGAGRFYTAMAGMAAGAPFADTFAALAAAERGHARTVYRFWARTMDDPPGFDAVYERLSGEILEGGQALDSACRKLAAISGSRGCTAMMELALAMEYAAFDLYRTVAETAGAAKAREAFLTIAQAEKAHIQSLVRALGRCS